MEECPTRNEQSSNAPRLAQIDTDKETMVFLQKLVLLLSFSCCLRPFGNKLSLGAMQFVALATAMELNDVAEAPAVSVSILAAPNRELELHQRPSMNDSSSMGDQHFILGSKDHPVKDDDLCMGMYMAMYMDGFHWTSTACLNFFVSSWKLASYDSGACIFSFLLSVLMESLLAARSFLLRKAPSRYGLLMALYLFQAILGYLLMLVAMTFSMPLILALTLGLVVGNYLFSPSIDERIERDTRVVQPQVNNGIQQLVNTTFTGSLTLRRRG